MPNKSLIGMLVVGSVLLASSCQNDHLDEVHLNNSVVKFSFDDITRAVGDGTSADTLMYALFDTEGVNVAKGGAQIITTNNTRKAIVEVPVAKQQEYTAAFWAQSKSCDDYKVTISNLVDNTGGMVVSLNTDNLLNNDSKADAFFAVQQGISVTDTVVDVALKRACAQVSLLVTAANWDAAGQQGIHISKSSAVLKQVPTTFNLVTGEVSNLSDVTYPMSNLLPTGEIDVVIDQVSYKYLSLGYAFAGPSTTIHAMEFKFEDTAASETYSLNLSEVPIQRNWRTNIIGTVPPSTTGFSVSMESNQ